MFFKPRIAALGKLRRCGFLPLRAGYHTQHNRIFQIMHAVSDVIRQFHDRAIERFKASFTVLFGGAWFCAHLSQQFTITFTQRLQHPVQAREITIVDAFCRRPIFSFQLALVGDRWRWYCSARGTQQRRVFQKPE
ncbi:Uncharacterised protein [Vibrio cholerae]|nr:Uncharacterised protein [Vibrio cholerae]